MGWGKASIGVTALVAAVGVLALPTMGYAELERVAFQCEAKTCYHWIPKIGAVSGWHRDESVISDYGMYALVPDGYTYETAEYVIYSRALHKPLVMDNPSLKRFIQQDKEDFVSLNPGGMMTEVPAVVVGSGKKLRSFVLQPAKQGIWEQVAYDEDGEYFVVLVISSKSSAGYKKALPVYRQILASYR